VVLGQLYAQGLVSDLPAPNANMAGAVATLAAPAGEILYTTDGTDPRKLGGKPSASARRWSGSVTLASGQQIHARAHLDGEWSAVTTMRAP